MYRLNRGCHEEFDRNDVEAARAANPPRAPRRVIYKAGDIFEPYGTSELFFEKDPEKFSRVVYGDGVVQVQGSVVIDPRTGQPTIVNQPASQQAQVWPPVQGQQVQPTVVVPANPAVPPSTAPPGFPQPAPRLPEHITVGSMAAPSGGGGTAPAQTAPAASVPALQPPAHAASTPTQNANRPQDFEATLNGMTVEQLRAHAAEEEIDLGRTGDKAGMIKKILAAK
jgi:hypothetical protein